MCIRDSSWRIYRYADVLLLAVELDVRINGTASADAQEMCIRDRYTFLKRIGMQEIMLSLEGS